ncbi:helical backbone metal receptor [Crenobacter luteus]|uniref:Cobalamin-binding protein n=1 Tax=Crenobacter luteus TaxID=1452487 RepID=A0A163CV32_9NEIS|nr:helical backbone metal receptor [Crenobacter luteus]KZE33237.1 cobalamin-binding protein [Crenobacter luteus]
MRRSIRGLAACAALAAGAAHATVAVHDATGRTVTLAHPAARIVALSPHAVELLYAAGAGARVVAAVDYSDFPPEAARLPRVGGVMGFSLEALVRQRPELVVAWRDGLGVRDEARLRALGIPLYISRPLKLDDVAAEIAALGRLAGSAATADAAAARYRARLAGLRQRYAGRAPVSVFYQVSAAPIFTVSDTSFVGQMVESCGGRNVFGKLPLPAPQVSVETVLVARPQVMLANDAATLAAWSRWKTLPAVAAGTRYVLPGDLVGRPGPRLVDGMGAVCAALEKARGRLGLTPR